MSFHLLKIYKHVMPSQSYNSTQKTASHFSKDDFQSILLSLRTPVFINIRSSHLMECKSIRYKPHTLSFFSNNFIDFTAVKLFYQVIRERMKHKALTTYNRGCFETLNLLHVGSCKRKQTLKSAQYRLEIIFK